MLKLLLKTLLVFATIQAIGAEVKSASEEIDEIPSFELDPETLDKQEAVFSIKQNFELSGSLNDKYAYKGAPQSFRYMPEFSLSNYYINENTVFNFSGILNANATLFYPTDDTKPKEHDIYLDVYRLWGRISYGGVMQATLGKQQLKFGNGFIFRPLSWFDNIKFYDQLKFSPARNALVLNFDPSLFTRFTFWGMYHNDLSFGYNAFNNELDSFSYGGRFEWMSPYSVLGLSYNNREIALSDEAQTFGYNSDGSENALGLDLKLSFLTLSLFSDISYSETKDIDTRGSSYKQLQQNVGFSLMAPIKGINYSFLGEYFYSNLDTDLNGGGVSGFNTDFDRFHGYDLIMSIALTSTDYLAFVWMDGIAMQDIAETRVQSLMLRWSRSFNYLKYGLNFYVNKGMDFGSFDGVDTITDIQDIMATAKDQKIYGVQASFKYTINNDFKVE